MVAKPLLETNTPGKDLFSRGKIRDTYIIPGWHRTDYEKVLLMVTTDRISAFDAVMREGVPELGKIRNQISLFWFNKLQGIFPNHIFSDDQQLCACTIKEEYRGPNDLIGRSALVYRASVIKVEFVVRGYLSGSAWEAYRQSTKICGIKLPKGLKESEKLPKPIFTPTTKAGAGQHDNPITFDKLVKMIGGEAAETLRDISLKFYIEADKWANIVGIIIADTKFEFGMRNGKIMLVDELLTPDSSRFWEFVTFRPGKKQPSFDKQPLRDWLKSTGWDGNTPPPTLSTGVIKYTRERYVEAFERLVGKRWSA